MNLKQPKASVLVFTLIVLFIGIAAAIGIASSSVTSQKNSITTASSVQSFQLADSGAEIFLNKLKDAVGSIDLTALGVSSGSAFTCEAGGIIRGNIGTGRDYEIIAYDAVGNALLCTATLSSINKIKSVGKYKNTSRAVEMAAASGGPDYDSGWFAESNTDHITTKTHNLGAYPTNCMIWFSHVANPSGSENIIPVTCNPAVYTPEYPNYSFLKNPMQIQISTTEIKLHFWTGVRLLSHWAAAGGGWHDDTSGYLRVLLWK